MNKPKNRITKGQSTELGSHRSKKADWEKMCKKR